MARLYLFLLFSFVILFLPLRSEAAEVIHRYDSRIVINDTGGLQVTETIEVTAEGYNIKRGIYRDFPLYRRTFLGGLLPSDYNIISVTRDGKAEPYHTEVNEGNLRLYIGSSGYYLPPGERYTYQIHYSIPQQVFFYDDYDELNWNAIATGWKFPIEKGSAEIILPDGAPVVQYAVYTGKALSKENDSWAQQGDGRLYVELRQSLRPYEGMTVAVAFPKGYVTQSADMAGMAFFQKQHPGLKAMLLGLLAMALYYYWAWSRVGRDPKGRGLAPFYDPPKDISPAMAAYIDKMGDSGTQKNMTAAILSLAAKGYLTIEEQEKYHYKLARTGLDPAKGPPISKDEQVIYKKIRTSLTIKPSSETLIETAKEHKQILDDLCRKHYFYTNIWWWLGGILPLIVSLVMVSFDPAIMVEELWIGLIFMLVFGGVSLGVFIYGIHQIITGPPSRKATGIFLSVWAMFFSMGGFMGLWLMAGMLSWLVIACIIIMTGLFLLMYKLMRAPTKEGRAVMDHLDGLRYYMEAVEEKILQKFDPPQMSRELYEKYLPYAMALGVESKWADKFALALAAGAAATAATTTSHHTAPSWYHGTSGSSFSSFSASSMVSSLGSSISAAATSNSSGSGGGGSSGGGGGGGGGGGW